MSERKMSDWDLVKWATEHGWKFFYSNDQLRDPEGYMTTFVNRSTLDSATRQRILSQMSGKTV